MCVWGEGREQNKPPCSASPLPEPGEIQVLQLNRKFPEALDLRILSTCKHNTQEIETTRCFQKIKKIISNFPGSIL